MSQFDIHRGENPRVLFLFGIVAAACLVLVAGLGWRQIIAEREYHQIEKQQTQRRILKPGPRGDIYDRNGNLLVGNRPHYSAVVYLDDLRHDFRREYSALLRSVRETLPDDELPNYNDLQWEARLNVVQHYLDEINRITGRDEQFELKKLIRHFNEQLLLPLPLVKDLGPAEYARLVEQIPVHSPIQIYTDSVRYYPYGVLAAHTLGYVQEENPSDEEIPKDGIKTFTFKTKRGRTGLERSFDAYLKGETGMEVWRVDPLGFQDTLLDMKASKQGNSLITSIDIDIQQAAETALGNRTGAAVALDVQTGEVLAIASHPSYDLNRLSPFIPRTVFEEIDARGAWLNRSIQLSYPPGSTFKLITSIAGMRNGTIPEGTVHECTGVFPLGRRVFRCHARYGHGQVDLQKAIEVSCNTFFYAEGLEMGIDVLSAEAKRFGLDQKTGIRLPYETSRLVVPSKEWKKGQGIGGWVPGDTANTAIGQGFLLVTPLQMATVIASIARGETRTHPSILALTDEQAKQVDHGGEPIGLSARDRARLIAGMERVVGPDGTGRLVHINGFRIAGKTGTADFRAHGKDVNLAWFVGFAPVERPRIAVAVMVEGTQSSDAYHGGSTAGPVAKDIFLKFIDKYPERAGFPVATTPQP